jgi:ATP-dependent Clp protease ATP-binding subunit ClpC
MYRRWARERRMRLEVLVDRTSVRRTADPWRWVASVSGPGAWSILQQETGLHVWEEPAAPGREGRLQARVRVEPLVADGDADPRRATAALAAPAPDALRLVRIYRSEPAPLVRDRLHGWRSGRLERVLAGHFDLEGASRLARRGAAAD